MTEPRDYSGGDETGGGEQYDRLTPSGPTDGPEPARVPGPLRVRVGRRDGRPRRWPASTPIAEHRRRALNGPPPQLAHRPARHDCTHRRGEDTQLVKKRQRRLGEVDEVALSLYAGGLTTGEISAHFADVNGANVSKDTVLVDAAGSPTPPHLLRAWSPR